MNNQHTENMARLAARLQQTPAGRNVLQSLTEMARAQLLKQLDKKEQHRQSGTE